MDVIKVRLGLLFQPGLGVKKSAGTGNITGIGTGAFLTTFKIIQLNSNHTSTILSTKQFRTVQNSKPVSCNRGTPSSNNIEHKNLFAKGITVG